MGPDNIYKSAIEPFTRDDMSEPNKVQIQRILDVVWLKMTTDIAASRNITTEQINSIANELKVRKPEDAVTLGLLDGVVYYDQILENLRGKLGLEADGEIESVSIKDYVNSKSGGAKKSTDDKSWELKDEVAVIYAVGGINSGEGDDENIGSETLAKAIREARTNEDVKAIVMRVVSPGGSAMASDVIWREAKLAAETKPFVVSFGSVAASGGYYISTHAKRIFANENTITGSIGVFGIIPDARELLTEKMGITFDGVKTNAHADFGSMKHGFDEAELTLLSEYVSETYREFVSRVAEGRGMTYEEVDSIARGRVWIGADAISIGLVDEIGGMDDAIAYAAKEAGLESYDLIELPKQKDPWESFFEDLSGNAKAQVGNWVFGNEYEWVKKVEELKTMQGIQTRMMFDIKVN
jgi:protease IV